VLVFSQLGEACVFGVVRAHPADDGCHWLAKSHRGTLVDEARGIGGRASYQENKSRDDTQSNALAIRIWRGREAAVSQVVGVSRIESMSSHL
jgi:hypothetical protein